jgi:phosphoethanolamine N-methyltransferase
MTAEPAQYDKDFTNMLELMWGEHFLSPGGNKVIDKIFRNIDLTNQKVLDIGCGLGGPALYLAKKYKANIIGIDIEPNLVKDAQQRAIKTHNLKGHVQFSIMAKEEPLNFANNSFDIIFGKESWLHIKNKELFFQEIFRILKPGGIMVSLDWMHASAEYSTDMQQFVVIDGLDFSFITPKEYKQLLTAASFKNISFEDTSAMSLSETEYDYSRLLGELKQQVIDQFGEEYYQNSLASWKLQAKVFANKELLTGIFTAYKLA